MSGGSSAASPNHRNTLLTIDAKNMGPQQIVTPAQSFTLISASANTIQLTRAVYVGASGTVDWTDAEGNASSAVAVVAGSIIPVHLSKVTALNGGAILYALR